MNRKITHFDPTQKQLTPLMQYILSEFSGSFESVEFQHGKGNDLLKITVCRGDLKADTKISQPTVTKNDIRRLREQLIKALNEAEKRLD